MENSEVGLLGLTSSKLNNTNVRKMSPKTKKRIHHEKKEDSWRIWRLAYLAAK
jgi:hypothetical protein